MEKRLVFIGGFKEYKRTRLPQPGVFIAHDFIGGDEPGDRRDAQRKIEDYRIAYEDGLRDAGYTPIYAPIYSGTILETLCQDMVNTEAGIFDVSFGRKYNANVLIELGICLGLNQPAILIAEEADRPLLGFLDQLRPFYYRDEGDLADRIGAVVNDRIQQSQQKRLSPYYCAICDREKCDCRGRIAQEEKRYLLVGSDVDELDRHVKAVAKEFHIQPVDPTLTPHLALCGWLQDIRRSKLTLIYSKEFGNRHHGAANAAAMVQLGLAVGAGIPWRSILLETDEAPTDVKGYVDIRFGQSSSVFRELLKGAVGSLLSEHHPFHGIYEVFEPDIPLEEEVSVTTSIAAPEPTPQAPPPTPNVSSKMERFTQRARRVLSLAQEEAERLQNYSIGPEHLLLGLIREEGGVAGRVFRELGVDLLLVKNLVEKQTRITPRADVNRLELSLGTKQVLEFAIDEARRLGHLYIGTEHLLLGLIRLTDDVAIDILRELGVTPEEVRRQTRRVLMESPVLNPPPEDPSRPST